jgi:hypothetical protein
VEGEDDLLEKLRLTIPVNGQHYPKTGGGDSNAETPMAVENVSLKRVSGR